MEYNLQKTESLYCMPETNTYCKSTILQLKKRSADQQSYYICKLNSSLLCKLTGSGDQDMDIFGEGVLFCQELFKCLSNCVFYFLNFILFIFYTARSYQISILYILVYVWQSQSQLCALILPPLTQCMTVPIFLGSTYMR